MLKNKNSNVYVAGATIFHSAFHHDRTLIVMQFNGMKCVYI